MVPWTLLLLGLAAGQPSADTDSDQKVTFAEFEVFVRGQLTSESRSSQELRVLFDAFDADSSGVISVAEYERFANAMHRPPSFFEELEKDGDEGWFDWMLKPGQSRSTNARFIVTSDLFNTESTAVELKKTLREFLGHREGLASVWIHDARAGLDEVSVARAWMMDGWGELRSLAECGVSTHAGLWVNRWKGLGGEFGMTVAERLEPDHFDQEYEETNLTHVRALIDRAALLYLPGGNPYALLDALTRNPDGAAVWAHARRRIDRGELLVLTRSAGSIVVGATVDVSTERPKGWRGDAAGLGLAPRLAFIPHFHLPHAERIVHGERWRAAVAVQAWSKEDFLLELVAREQTTGVRGVPLREGWFMAHDGAQPPATRWTTYEGPAAYRLPSWLGRIVQRLDPPFWKLLWYVADVRLAIERKRRAEVATWGQLGSVIVAVVWLVGYVLLGVAAFSAVSVRLGKKVTRRAA